MREPVDIEALRRRAACALGEVQRLAGFAAKLAEVGDPPEFARGWSWDAVVNATESDSWRPGAIRWEDRPTEPAKTSVLVGRRDAKLPSAGPGMVRAPVDEPLPAAADRDALSSYRASVWKFASRYVLGAHWSARAVHDAIRLGRSISLPDRPEPFLAPPIDGLFTLDPRQPLPRSVLVELGEALLKTAKDDSFDASKVSGPMPGDAMWEGAIKAVGLRHAGKAVPSSQRSQAKRLRPWLNAAVSGPKGGPLHRVDHPDYAKDRRRAKRVPPNP